MRRFVTLLILVPLAAVIVLFSVANRESVTVSLDPFHADAPAVAFSAPNILAPSSGLTLATNGTAALKKRPDAELRIELYIPSASRSESAASSSSPRRM